jgi:hypothetical protein
VDAFTVPRNVGNLNYTGPILLFEICISTTPCKNLSLFSFIRNKIENCEYYTDSKPTNQLKKRRKKEK